MPVPVPVTGDTAEPPINDPGLKNRHTWDLRHLEKSEALAQLVGKPQGSFVIWTTNKAYAAISVIINSDGKQYNQHIEMLGNGNLRLKTSDKEHATLDALVEHYLLEDDEENMPTPLDINTGPTPPVKAKDTKDKDPGVGSQLLSGGGGPEYTLVIPINQRIISIKINRITEDKYKLLGDAQPPTSLDELVKHYKTNPLPTTGTLTLNTVDSFDIYTKSEVHKILWDGEKFNLKKKTEYKNIYIYKPLLSRLPSSINHLKNNPEEINDYQLL